MSRPPVPIPVLTVDNRLGGSSRLVFHPLGQPLMQVPEDVRRCVAFLALNRNSGMSLAGTVFFVGWEVKIEEPPKTYYLTYAVTARHVLEDIGKYGNDATAYLKINPIEGDVVTAGMPLSQWVYSDDQRIDAAVTLLGLDSTKLDFRTIPTSMFLTNEVIAKEAIGPGDDLFFPGLFSKRPGTQRNIPIMRTGNIAAMPDEYIRTEWGYVRGYLAEARSIGGLSGSPVFVHTGALRHGSLQIGGTQFYFLGLVHGHYGVKEQLDSEDAQSSEATRSVNMGIAIVVPADDIRAILNKPELAVEREGVIKKIIEMERNQLPEAD